MITLSIDLHDSWLGHPLLAELLVRVRGLAAPAPAAAGPPPAPREPGGDDDLSVLLGGMDDVPAPPTATVPYKSPHATPESRRPPPTPVAFDGVPRTGQALYKWACNHKVLPQVNSVGKARGWHKLVTHWEPDQVSVAYLEVNAALTPAGNGRHPERSRS